jgi:transcriptional regulator with XRE-family HTH domain
MARSSRKNDVDRKALATVIKRMRESRGLLVREVAAALEIGDVSQYRRESGENGIPAEDVPRYAAVYNVTPDRIYEMMQCMMAASKSPKSMEK